MLQNEATLLDAMQETAKAVAAYTGIKRQFTESGWSDEGAEGMVIAMLRAAANRQEQ
jgi:hypothetical protein